MRLDHSFTVPASAGEAWDVLLDVPRIAPCMPGAELGEYDGERFTGTVRVRVGPVTLLYKGKGRFATIDEAARRVVIEASGREARGSGTAAATVTATLHDEGEVGTGTTQGPLTRVAVTTELTITGRPAQFGRAMLSDVGGKLIGRFAACLEQAMRDSSDRPPDGDPAESGGKPDASGPSDVSGTGELTGAGAPGEKPTVSAATGGNGPAGPEVAARRRPEIDLLEVTGARRALRRYGPYILAAVFAAVALWVIVGQVAGS